MQCFLVAALIISASLVVATLRPHNPILPGFHPDPSCIFVQEWNLTFFCASSSFNAFPGIPIHASQDLQSWRLIGNALSRADQLPSLTNAVGGTSGIWAPTLRYHDGEFFILTTLVFDKMPINDTARWNNIIFRTKNPYMADAWSDPVHFRFDGYDSSPFWHEDGTVYVQGSHPWEVSPHIDQIKLNLETGEATEQTPLWNGTGGLAPEGPHMHLKDGFYYLIIAEGGTGLNHMVTAARSKQITGPFAPAPHNPLLTNANTSAYFQTVGHADVFQDSDGRWWGVALSTRSGPEYISYPMGRETVLTNMTWAKDEWPVFENVSGIIDGPILPLLPDSKGDGIDFAPKTTIPLHWAHWRIPDPMAYTVSPPGHENSLRLLPSLLNLTGFDANSAPTPQTFVGRRQVHSEFVFSVDMEYAPRAPEEEAGVSVFLTQNHHIDFGIVCLADTEEASCDDATALRIRTTSTTATTPRPDTIIPLAHLSRTRLEIRADNLTHYTFSYAQIGGTGTDRIGVALTLAGFGLSADVSWGFTGASFDFSRRNAVVNGIAGTMLGVYATGNGRNASTPAYVSRWRYEGVRQVIDNEAAPSLQIEGLKF
ncbi:arabinofuranosidase [Mycena pura]|uniref:Arabinofuranosidase n=1 Tax=Mycena pura TaxID=153505 RepID=A0AAD6VR39_9AGAR|nr:arabinofuranosidase [Mycena pura]